MTEDVIEMLRRELADQAEKLAAIEAEYRAAIKDGERAQRIVAAQQRRVDEVAEAIDVLVAHRKTQQIEVIG